MKIGDRVQVRDRIDSTYDYRYGNIVAPGRNPIGWNVLIDHDLRVRWYNVADLIPCVFAKLTPKPALPCPSLNSSAQEQGPGIAAKRFDKPTMHHERLITARWDPYGELDTLCKDAE